MWTVDKHGTAIISFEDHLDVKQPSELRLMTDTTIDREDLDKALGYIEAVIGGAYGRFMQPGCRNDQAVDLSIALHVLGHDPIAWVHENLPRIRRILKHEITSRDAELFDEHLERISYYLEDWSYSPWSYTLVKRNPLFTWGQALGLG